MNQVVDSAEVRDERRVSVYLKKLLVNRYVPIGAGFVALSWMALIVTRPPSYPKEWDTISNGMDRNTVRSLMVHFRGSDDSRFTCGAYVYEIVWLNQRTEWNFLIYYDRGDIVKKTTIVLGQDTSHSLRNMRALLVNIGMHPWETPNLIADWIYNPWMRSMASPK